MKSIELLSPARNLECGIAAVEHGADAVYIGAPRFGARAAAGNSIEDIGALCYYAHRFGAKVYAAVNTLLYEDELEEACHLAWELYHAGVDALIIQDTVFLEMEMPPIPLHASTQMDNRTTEKVIWLKNHGFNQIVLARELSLEQIKDIHEAVPEVRLEAFVHGALCVSYSGRCYASEYCFGRSANRGECAQFCRLPFSLQDVERHTLVKDKYLLSLKDMNRQKYLEEMLDAGVQSFKIEGRLKDISYVKNVTASYRQALDVIMKQRPEFVRSSFGTSTFTFTPDLSRSFSRGNTDYFLKGYSNDLASSDTPKSRGREVGRVKEVRNGCIIVSSCDTFSNGDGFCYFDTEGRLQGFRVNRADGNHLYPASDPQQTFPSWGKLKKGDLLWRSFDQQWERLMSGKTAERRISARFLLEETEQGFRLTFTAEDGTQRNMEFPSEHQPARTDQTASIRDVLSKLGDTPYVCKDIEVRFPQPWFIPRSTLAEWRRSILDGSPGTTERLGDKASEIAQHSILNGPSYLAHPNAEIFQDTKHTPLMICRFCIRHAWGRCKKFPPPPEKHNVQWKDPLFLVLGDGRRFRLEFDCKNCEMKVLNS